MGNIFQSKMNSEESKLDNAMQDLDNLFQSRENNVAGMKNNLEKMKNYLEKEENDSVKMKLLFQTVMSETTIIRSKKVRSMKDEVEDKLLSTDNEKQEADKYLPLSSDHQKILQEKYKLEDIIKHLTDQLQKEKEQNNQLIRALNENSEEMKKENKFHGDSQKFINLESQYNINQDTNKKLKLEGNDLNCQLVQNNPEYSSQKTEMNTSIEQVRNELTETTQVRNQLQKEVSKLEAEKTDFIMTIEKLKKYKELDDKNATEEIHMHMLERQIIELQEKEKRSIGQFALLQKENERLGIEIGRLMAKPKEKKYISFHSVLKQPQSDQAVNGILDLLRGQYSDTDLETVEESKRKKNTPLLVVLYNLSRIADDVKGALSGIEASSDVALVILHSKEIKKPSEKILTESDFKKLGIIVDIKFLTAKGIISDDVTDKAIHQLVGFINQF